MSEESLADSPMISKSVRLRGDQITDLKKEARRQRAETKRKCGWTELVRDAVDHFLERRMKTKQAA